jgi:DeoR/GlpR family transcriptional regulator of sugar metabolism
MARVKSLEEATSLPEERQRLILDRLERTGRVVAGQLAQEFGISEDTIRRDLRELADAGLCKRVYGGALPPSPGSPPIKRREQEAPARKQVLGQRAAELVRPEMILFLDAGSTNLAISKSLPEGQNLTVITNAPGIAESLVERVDIELQQIGGRIDHRSGAALGALAVRDVERIHFDLCFLGACAIDAQIGVTAVDAEEAAFKRILVERSGQVAVAVTNEKLGTAAPYQVAILSEIDDLVIEADAPTEVVETFNTNQLRIHTASPIGKN